jgi:cytochrome c oxidase assembly protein subunit 15
LSRLLFISTKNRWFYRITMLVCGMAFALAIMSVGPQALDTTQLQRFESIHRYLALSIAVLIACLTISAPFYKNQFSLQPFVIGIILLPLSVLQIMLCLMTAKQETNSVVMFAHLLVGVAIFSFLWWMGRLTSPESPPMTHSSTHKWRPWAWLALLFLLTQVALGAWISSNFNLNCNDFLFCNGQFFPNINMATLSVLLNPIKSFDAATLGDIQLIYQYGMALAALYLALFSLFLLFNRYLYQLAILMVMLLGIQVSLNVYAIGWQHPEATIFYYYAASMLLLITVITLLTNLYRKSQYYWYG